MDENGPMLDVACKVSDGGCDLSVTGISVCGSGEDQVVCCGGKLTGNVWDGQLRLFKVGEEEIQKECALRTDVSMSDVVWLAASKTFAAAGDDGNVVVYSVEVNSNGLKDCCVQIKLEEHEDCVTSLSYGSIHNRRLISAGYDGLIHAWDLANTDQPVGRFGKRLSLESPIVWDVVDFEREGFVASAHQDGHVRFWDSRAAYSAELKLSSDCDPWKGGCLSLSNCIVDNSIACGYENGTVSVFDVRKMADCVNSQTHRAGVNCVDLFQKNGKTMIISGGDDGRVVVSSLLRPGYAIASSLGSEYVRALSLRSTQQQAIVGDWDAKINVYNL